MKAISFIKNNAIAMSIALAAIIGFSAFKAAESETQTERVLAYNATSNQYEEVSNYSDENCEPGTEICSYKTEAPAGSSPGQVPSEIPLDDLGDYIHLMEQNGPSESQYDFNTQ